MTIGAFGEIPEKRWDDGDRSGWELPNPFGELPDSLWDSRSEQFQDDISAWVYSLGLDVGALRPQLPNLAAHHILTAAANDAIALLAHVDRYDGRSAAHAARALYEHLVNLMDVTSSGANTSDRYLDHRYVTADQVSKRTWHLPLLKGRTRRREKDRLDELRRKVARKAADAVTKWGKSFRRGWAEGNLLERATAHGIEDGYEGYRILSGVIHGSSGGLSGLVREVQGTPVHRIGPDMQLAAVAYREGLLSMYEIAGHLVTLTGRMEAERLRGLTANLLHGTQEVMEGLQHEDNKMWPTAPPPPGLAAIAGIYPSGRVRWYVLETATETIAVAEPPGSEPKGFGAVRDKVVAEAAGGPNGRPVTVSFDPGAVQIQPKAGAKWVPASSVLVPPGHPGRFEKPIVLKPRG
ncbi:DUF5677 domain-containing protein [Cellulosimicrobium sp. KWT-B]|uniref:DUF5677 domain-containing protein n=1 Tax=Cellulosimicrobium sp. KWT-B TaxID=1981152 RepID=UPI000A323470|nr:DUF5677 domain-containing protein [Cellulosimicrobium sp. KWT-B]